MSYRKFRDFKSNCVRPETRASCIDPIEARCYDVARCLQLHFKGIMAARPKVRDYYQQGGQNDNDFYDPFEEDDTGEEQDDDGDAIQNFGATDNDDGDERGTYVQSTINIDCKCLFSQLKQFLYFFLDLSLFEEFQQCPCEDCQNGQGWLDIFSDMKGNLQPHRELLNKGLCPQIGHPDLTMTNQRPFRLHKWKCAKGECGECRIDKLLPFDCPLIKSSRRKIKVWIWDKATGDNERTMKTERELRHIFLELKESLVTFAAHTVPLQMWNQMRHLAVHNVIQNPQKVIAFSDFSSQIDLEPVRKVNCHVNKHASLGIFVLFLPEKIIIEGREIEFIACHEWYIFGSCEEKGKKNDWIFHNAAFDYIIKHYSHQRSEWEIWTDNCPGQVCV